MEAERADGCYGHLAYLWEVFDCSSADIWEECSDLWAALQSNQNTNVKTIPKATGITIPSGEQYSSKMLTFSESRDSWHFALQIRHSPSFPKVTTLWLIHNQMAKGNNVSKLHNIHYQISIYLPLSDQHWSTDAPFPIPLNEHIQ